MFFEQFYPSHILRYARVDTPAIGFVGGTPIVDNYFTRVLNGVDTYFSPLGSITRAHLERAKEILMKFEVVMILEDWEFTSRQLLLGLGWKETSVGRVVNRFEDMLGTHLYKKRMKEKMKKPFTDEEIDELMRLNSLDIELYQFASALARNITNRLIGQANALRST